MGETLCMQFLNWRTVNRKSKTRNLKLCALALGALLLAVCFPVQAQQPAKVWKIGVLVSTSRALNASREDNLWQGLRQLGYVEARMSLWSTGMPMATGPLTPACRGPRRAQS